MNKYALGIDLGGTGTKFGLVNSEGKVLRSNSIPTQQYPDINEYCDALCAGLKRLVADEGLPLEDIIGIGCGAPNACARALLNAVEIMEKSPIPAMLKERYASFDSGIGKDFEEGKLTFEQVYAYGKQVGEPKQVSGKQELYEAIVALYTK